MNARRTWRTQEVARTVLNGCRGAIQSRELIFREADVRVCIISASLQLNKSVPYVLWKSASHAAFVSGVGEPLNLNGLSSKRRPSRSCARKCTASAAGAATHQQPRRPGTLGGNQTVYMHCKGCVLVYRWNDTHADHCEAC